MRKFLERAIKTIPRMNKEQLESLLNSLKEELVLKEMVMGSLNQGILVSDQEDRIVYFNKALNRLLPMHRGDHSDNLVWTMINNDDIYLFIKESLFYHKTIHNKIFIIEIDGKTTILSLSIIPLASKGKIYGNVILIDDVTDEKEKEIKLKRAESLASLTTMAAGVAHEIKNPLGSMSIHIQLMEKILRKDQFNKEAFQKYLSIISDEVERLNSIVVDYLFAVRPMNIEAEEGDINIIIKELIDFTKYELSEANIEIKLDLSKSLPKIFFDSKFIKQAFLNIIKNAIQAMGNGGTLSIKTRKRDNKAIVCITDTGIGMDDKTLDKVFEPHFTTKDTGSGLGLTVVYKIIKEHRGDIDIVSKKGEGTTFIFSFPGIANKEKLLLNWEENGI